MEFLQFVKCSYRILVLNQKFSLLAKVGLEFEVLLEVQIAELLVYLEEIVESLY